MGFTSIAAALAAAIAQPASPAATPALPDADPAIWVINDPDTTIYLFGTFHALDGRTNWFNDEVSTAFNLSDELVLETVLPTMAPPAPVPQFGFHRFATPSLQSGASFLASTRVALSAGRSQGLTVDKGADAVLRRAAEAAGKPVSGIESFEFQIAMFERMPASKMQEPRAGQPVDTMQDMSRVLATLHKAWNHGDGNTFATMLEGLRRNSPETYRLLFVERNANWAQWISNRLTRPGTVFVAVGAGHLAGPDSVQNKLAQIGVATTRIN